MPRQRRQCSCPRALAHTYRASERSRYLIILPPRTGRLIERLLDPAQQHDVRPTLRDFDTEIAEHDTGQSDVLSHTLAAQEGPA
jgi:hypothetical protein